jgi:hypothetical protein
MLGFILLDDYYENNTIQMTRVLIKNIDVKCMDEDYNLVLRMISTVIIFIIKDNAV